MRRQLFALEGETCTCMENCKQPTQLAKLVAINVPKITIMAKENVLTWREITLLLTYDYFGYNPSNFRYYVLELKLSTSSHYFATCFGNFRYQHVLELNEYVLRLHCNTPLKYWSMFWDIFTPHGTLNVVTKYFGKINLYVI